MSDITFYADGDSVTFRLRTRDLDGNMVDVDSATITILKCTSTAERDWLNGTAVTTAVNGAAFTNFDTGVYRYSWSTTDDHAGRYVAEATVTRGGVTNTERILVELR